MCCCAGMKNFKICNRILTFYLFMLLLFVFFKAETEMSLSAMESIRSHCELHNIFPISYICKPCEGARRLN